MKNKIAVILAGCGYLDGTEIREAVLTFLALEKNNLEYDIYAPNKDQFHVINHITGEEEPGKRNVLIESARIARGNISALTDLNPEYYSALIMPGGFGVAKNLSDLAFKGADMKLDDNIRVIIQNFHASRKPIGAICISPAVVTGALKEHKPIVTLGDRKSGELITKQGASHKPAKANEIVVDKENILVTTPAYMLEAGLPEIAEGIEKLVKKIGELIPDA